MPVILNLIEYTGAAERTHHALFIQTNENDGTGVLFHVVGDVLNGMTYQSRYTKAPGSSATFECMHELGWVSSSDIPRIDKICRSNPPPEKQYIGFKKINPKRPLRRCQEWTAETIALLEQEGVLHREGSQQLQQPAQPSGSGTSRSGKSSSRTSSSKAQSSSASGPVDGQTSSDGFWTWSEKYKNWYHLGKDGSTTWAAQRQSEGKGKGRA